MAIELPPDGIGKRPRPKRPVPRVDLELTPDDRDGLKPVVEKMRSLVMDNVGHAGFDCPACQQLVAIYLTPLPAKAVQLLLLLYCEYGAYAQPFHLRNDGQPLWGDHPLPVEIWMFALWGLIEPQTMPEQREREDGTLYEVEVEVSGMYYVSDYGERFLHDKLEIPSHLATYNGRPLWLDTAQGYDVYQGVTRTFDLTELLDAPTESRMRLLLSGNPVRRPRRTGT